VKRSKRIEITRESRSVIRVRVPEDAVRGWCPACQSEVQWIALTHARILSAVSEREIHRRLESGALHSSKTLAGTLLVCLNSLQERLNDK
jgi:hypothetical protein